MKKYKFISLIVIGLFLIAVKPKAQSFYNVISYGAKNDSSTIATKAIAKAIAAASKAGGGTVYFPAGKYLTGPIHLKSNISIFIDAGAELHFSDNFDNYLPMVPSRYEGVDVTSFSPLFYAYGAENISITGRGIIDGHGKKWWDFVEGYKKDQPRSKWQYVFDSLNKNILLPDDAAQMKRGFLRPPFIQTMYCKNVLIEGISIRNSPFWTVNPEFSENVTVHAVTINNPHSPNTDGINPESCKYVHISNCHISVGDDCITIKSGKDIPGRTKQAPAEDYTITNCTMLSGHGGVVIGSEMSGDVRRIAISNCIFDGTDKGIRIKTTRGRGGVVEDIRVSNIVMNNIKDIAFVMDMQYSKTKEEPLSERTPRFRNIHISNVTGNAKQAAYINGLEEMPVSDISFHDINLVAEDGFVLKNAKNLSFHQVQVVTKNSPPISAMNVSNLELDGIKALISNANLPVLRLQNTSNVFIHGCTISGTGDFLQLKGAENKDMLIKGNYFSKTIIPLKKEIETLNNIILEDTNH